MNLYRISVSSDSRGGRLVDPWEQGSKMPPGQQLLTIFVPGFNNNKYRTTDRWDNYVFPGIEKLTHYLKGNAVLFTWPGDTDTLRPIASLRYAAKVPVAIAAGIKLGEYLRGLAVGNPELKVQFVGHSLGCRVVLSAVSVLAKDPDAVPVTRTLLMGAAVPEGDCLGPLGQWHQRLSDAFCCALDADPAASRLALKETVLYSPDDGILGRVFDFGELRARRRGVKSQKPYRAVGLVGGPAGRWVEVKRCNVKHDKYPESTESLRYVAELFGPLKERSLKETRTGERAQSERIEDGRWPESRLLGSRRR
jgi:hypothetical protein